MRIAYVSTYLPKQCGIAIYTDYLIHGIREVDPTAEIKIVAEQGASPFEQDKFEVIPSWDRNEDYVESIISYTKGADIIHIQHEYSIYKFDDRLPLVLQGLDANAKKIITIHCVRPAQISERGAVDENFAARIAQLADQVIVHLKSQKVILARLGIPSKKIHVISHGTELSNEDQKASRKMLGLPTDAKVLLMFGFVKKHKCLHVVLEALVEILEKFKDVYLFVAGGLAPTASQKDRDYAEFVGQRIVELDLQKNVIYPNKFFPNEDVPYLFGASDIVLFPYYEEDLSASGSLHLALGANKPVIASRIPKFEELKEVCDELLVLPYNSSGIAKIALRLFEDPEFERFVLDRTEQFKQRTSWQAVAKQHLEVYVNEIGGGVGTII
ncbi:MAG: glycosyltransferase family 4 protein [Halobacteriota archaeon]